jgi:hypothetical protein
MLAYISLSKRGGRKRTIPTPQLSILTSEQILVHDFGFAEGVDVDVDVGHGLADAKVIRVVKRMKVKDFMVKVGEKDSSKDKIMERVGLGIWKDRMY